MHRLFPTIVLAAVLLGSIAHAADPIRFRTDHARFELNDRGAFTAIQPNPGTRNYIAPAQPAAALSLRIAGKIHAPDRAEWDDSKDRLTLHFSDAKARAVLFIQSKSTHLTLELVEVSPADSVELAIWGPYPTTIGETIGEIVGVVRDREVAVGIQSLNPKTLGGSPAKENDIDHEFGADDTGYYPNLPDELKKGQGFRGDTARGTAFGSVLQAYARHRNTERILSNWGHDKYRVAPYSDGGVVGSRIALFACRESEALATLGAIEVAEGLPHPMLNGVWAKVSPESTASYLIVDFSEATIDRAIEMTRRAGLKYLYHSSPFATWGSFQLKPALFPKGWDSFKVCVEKANRAGIQLGFHTLSNFITPNDPLVTPSPDPRLSIIGSAELARDIDASASEIEVRNPEYFQKKSTLNTVRIGNELIRFESVSTQAPWVLTKCVRGAWGTKADPHRAGDSVGRLLDHEYRVFFSDMDLSREISRRIAEFCNHTGARQISFDGLEGNWSTGYGQYARTLFTVAWHDALNSALRGQVINDASNPGHFNWHVNTRMNWGEPWYAGFRESQTLYRFKNQVLFERNFMPHMLGWFALRNNTTLEDAEWLLARAAGFDAGFALATSLASTAQLDADPASADTAKRFGATTAILAAIAQWETARMARVFPESVRAALRDNSREFHLQGVNDGHWDLFEAHVTRLNQPLGPKTRPAAALHRNPSLPQSIQWIVRSDSKEPITNVYLELNGQRVPPPAEPLPPGGAWRYSGQDFSVITDANGKEVNRFPYNKDSAWIGSGLARIVAGGSAPTTNATLRVEIRTLSEPTRIQRPQ